MELDWHAERADLEHLRTLDDVGEGDGIDLVAVRRHRLERVRSRMVDAGIDACVLVDPVNIRYATGARNMQVFHSRNPARYAIVTADGPVVLFEFTGCFHLAEDLETIDEVRPAITASFVAAGAAVADRESAWAADTAAVLEDLIGRDGVVGIERVNAGAARRLEAHGYTLRDAQEPVELARAIKSAEEMKCIRESIAATEVGVERLRAAIRPGITENDLWAVLHQAVIELDGDYIETRLLNSGRRTNPWFQESSSRVIEANELIALDTDVVGRHGYYADFSRTFHSGPATPTAHQRELYQVAHEQVQHNLGILRPGLTFREYSEQAWHIPDRFFANRYYLSAHGVGMTGEYPYLYHRADFADAGYDGVIEPRMTLCVESYIGEAGGAEGVKLEEQVLVTDEGVEVLSDFPFEESLLG